MIVKLNPDLFYKKNIVKRKVSKRAKIVDFETSVEPKPAEDDFVAGAVAVKELPVG
jgi:hypothetical protein